MGQRLKWPEEEKDWAGEEIKVVSFPVVYIRSKHRTGIETKDLLPADSLKKESKEVFQFMYRCIQDGESVSGTPCHSSCQNFPSEEEVQGFSRQWLLDAILPLAS